MKWSCFGIQIQIFYSGFNVQCMTLMLCVRTVGFCACTCVDVCERFYCSVLSSVSEMDRKLDSGQVTWLGVSIPFHLLARNCFVLPPCRPAVLSAVRRPVCSASVFHSWYTFRIMPAFGSFLHSALGLICSRRQKRREHWREVALSILHWCVFLKASNFVSSQLLRGWMYSSLIRSCDRL